MFVKSGSARNWGRKVQIMDGERNEEVLGWVMGGRVVEEVVKDCWN